MANDRTDSGGTLWRRALITLSEVIHNHKSLCEQGWMAFSSQSYQGHNVLEGEKPSLAVLTAALFG